MLVPFTPARVANYRIMINRPHTIRGLLLAFAILVNYVATARGDSTTFSGIGATADWNDGSQWTGGTPPTVDSSVLLPGENTDYELQIPTVTGYADSLEIQGNSTSQPTLLITNTQALNVQQDLQIATIAGATGTVNVNNGALHVAGNVIVGGSDALNGSLNVVTGEADMNNLLIGNEGSVSVGNSSFLGSVDVEVTTGGSLVISNYVSAGGTFSVSGVRSRLCKGDLKRLT